MSGTKEMILLVLVVGVGISEFIFAYSPSDSAKVLNLKSSTLIPYKLLLIPKIIFGTVVGLLFFNITFGWPDKYNKFFYPDYVEFMWPMLLATVACFVFGAWATKDTRRKGLFHGSLASFNRVLIFRFLKIRKTCKFFF